MRCLIYILFVLAPFLAVAEKSAKNENLSKTIEYLKKGELDSAKKYVNLVFFEGDPKNELKALYYRGYLYKELFKKDEKSNPDSPYRISSIEDFTQVLTFKDTTYHLSTRKILKYLGSTYYNDIALGLESNSIAKSKSLFTKFILIMENANPKYDIVSRSITFNLALSNQANAKWDVTNDIKYYNISLGLLKEVLALDKTNTTAEIRIARLKNKYSTELLAVEKKLRIHEDEKRITEINLLNNEKELLEREKRINEHELIQEKLEIEKNQAQIRTQKEKIEQEKNIMNLLYSGIGLLILFAGFMINRYRLSQKQNLIIEKQRDEVEEAHKEIRDSINYAERIQRSFLATDELLDNNLKDYFVFFHPKDVVSGDFYWASKLANNNFVVVNADSTGHGVPGAIMSILNISSIEEAIKEGSTAPSEIFNKVRKFIIERLSKDGSKEGGKDGMDASIISFDFENSKFSYTAAQNPIWIIRNNELIEIKGEKMPIGRHDNDGVPFVGGELETQKGDVVYTLTDGFQDQFGGEKGKKFKVRPFKELLVSIAPLPMQEQKEILNDKFVTWKGEEEQVDDVCVIGVRV